jgi:Bacterial SCP ortholog
MPPRRLDPRGPQSVAAVLRALDGDLPPEAAELGAAARYLLQLLATRHPGRVLEVRIPPVAAVQCLPGPVHTRGTPPNVVETDPVTWVRLATGRLAWADAIGSAAVRASGPRADLAPYLPLS